MSLAKAWGFWTDERCDWLRALYADGLSAGRIASEMGISDRGAVCGKIHRLGLTRDGGTKDSLPRPQPGHKPKPKPRPARREQFKPHVRLAAPPPAPEPMPEWTPETYDNQIPVPQRCTLEQLTNTTCRWPVGTPGTPDFFFCGHDSADLNIGIPYCRVHGARASAGPGRAPDRPHYWGHSFKD